MGGVIKRAMIRQITIERLLRLGIGGLFVFSGTMKAINPAWFLDEAVMSFQLVGRESGWFVALMLPWFEIATGLCLIIGKWAYRSSIWQMLGLTLLFTAILAFSWSRGLDITCGCTGKTDNATHYPSKLAQNAFLAAGLIYLAWGKRGSKYPHTPMLMADGTADHRRPYN